MSARKSSSNLNDPVIFRQTMTKTIAEKQIRGIRGGEIVDESSGRDIKGTANGENREHAAAACCVAIGSRYVSNFPDEIFA